MTPDRIDHHPRQHGKTEALRRAIAEHTATMDGDAVELAVSAGVRRDAAELLADDELAGPVTLDELLTGVLSACTLLDELVDDAVEIRHALAEGDTAAVLELHAAADDLAAAWAATLAAAQTVSELLATRTATSTIPDAGHDL